ncbi:MAG: type I methionyl aminopeptidase [Planctomycetota bacterium]|jgi:methionyl aminopeptidase
MPERPIELKSAREIGRMRLAGLAVWRAHQAAARLVVPGVSTAELNAAIREELRVCGAKPLFLGYPGPTPFPAESCISVNEELVHGIPGPRKLKVGDVVSIDIGASVGGWCGDAAVTHPVGSISAGARALLQTTNRVLDLAIDLLGRKKFWSEVAKEMQDYVEAEGFAVVDSMVGHGIGRQMHESPQVPNYFSRKWAAAEDFELRPGLVLAIEPMVNTSTRKLACLADQWTMVATDGKYAAHFEHTVALTPSGARRLTAAPEEAEQAELPDWLRDPNLWVRW